MDDVAPNLLLVGDNNDDDDDESAGMIRYIP
jgi:vancomycin permeability regulator SanA